MVRTKHKTSAKSSRTLQGRYVALKTLFSGLPELFTTSCFFAAGNPFVLGPWWLYTPTKFLKWLSLMSYTTNILKSYRPGTLISFFVDGMLCKPAYPYTRICASFFSRLHGVRPRAHSTHLAPRKSNWPFLYLLTRL